MSCTSCYNGCVTVTPDECVRYTGLSIPALNISTGDTLKHVEQMITDKLVPLLTGTGDVIGLDISCPIIDEYLPAHTPNTKELFTATVSAICSLQYQVFNIDSILATLNADYSIGCLTGVTASSDTHDIVQAIITKLCATAAGLTALGLDVSTNYVKLADLNTLIAAYIAGTSGGSSNQQYLKMIPYTAMEYYGPLTNFDGTGAGISTLGWYKVYLCNGNNGTPDHRGRVGVGAINNVPGGALNPAVDPAFAGNPNYSVYDVSGANTVALNVSQLPSHSHNSSAISTANVNDPGHSHYCGHTPIGWSSSGTIGISTESPTNVPTTTSRTGITVDVNTTMTISPTGNNLGHANIQPVLACNYIMYIP
jgi:microcystin-dependent protein